MLGVSQKNALGLDISDLSLKATQLRRQGKETVFTSFNKTTIPAGIIEDGEIIKNEELVSLIKKTILE